MDLKLFILIGKTHKVTAIVFITCKIMYIHLIYENFLMFNLGKTFYYRFAKKLKLMFIIR